MINVTEPNRNIVWIASYPKSGNTWVRFLLSNLLYGPQESTALLNKLIPDVHASGYVMPEPGMTPAYAKTHYTMSEAMPHLERTAGYIYIVRNPVDVLLSNLNYIFVTQNIPENPGLREEIRTDYLVLFLGNRGDPRWKRLGAGTWDEHVSSWCDNSRDIPRMIVRYEDMLADTLSIAMKLCKFLGLEKDPAEIQRAVDNSSFGSMRAIEEKEINNRIDGFFFSPHRKKNPSALEHRFMNAGKFGEGNRHLSLEQRQAVLRLFQPVMERHGYSLDDEGRVVVR
jgi:hypothetical protein